jgi:hypothetical protein
MTTGSLLTFGNQLEIYGGPNRWTVRVDDGVVRIVDAFDYGPDRHVASLLAQAVPGVVDAQTVSTMNGSNERWTHHITIVVGVDGSAGSDQPVRCVAGLAAQRNLGLHIVHALCFGQPQYGLVIASGGALFDAVRRWW